MPTQTMKWREIDDTDPVTKWDDEGQCDEGVFLGGKPAGAKHNLLYEFRRTDGSKWKTWETYVLRAKLARVQAGDYVQIQYLGTDQKGKTKLFRVRVQEEDEI